MGIKIFGKNYWLNWTIACGIGEFLGIGAAAGIGFLQSNLLGEPGSLGEKVLLVWLMIFAGVIEGIIVGYFQWSVLHKRYISMRAIDWIIFTVLGAATAWLLGMTTSLAFGTETSSSIAFEPSGIQTALLAALMGVVLGTIFGFFQWIELRRHTPGAGVWILANLLGWAVGLTIIFLGASLPTAETGLAIMILIGAVSGLLAGLAVGAITGLFLFRLKYA